MIKACHAISCEATDMDIAMADRENSTPNISIKQARKQIEIRMRDKPNPNSMQNPQMKSNQARPASRRFTPPSAAGTRSSLPASESPSVVFLRDACSDLPESLSPLSVSTPRNPNARRCPSGRSCKLGARGRWRPRARPPIQGSSQRIMR